MIESLAHFFGTFLRPQPGLKREKPAAVPALFLAGLPRGCPLTGRWTEEIEYRMAELGYGLHAGLQVRAVPRSVPVPRRAHLQGDVLFISSGAVREGRFTERFLTYDLPYTLIDLPACRLYSDGEENAAEMAADYLALQRLADASSLSVWLDQYARKSRTVRDPLEADRLAQTLQEMCPEQVLARIAAYQGKEAAPCNSAFLERAVEIAMAAQAESGDTDALPAFRISPDTLLRAGIPEKGVQWLADRYGWVRGETGWGACFLPLQTLAIARGVCDPQRLLYSSGVVSATTSAGKTLLAEMRLLARFCGDRERSRKNVFLAPTSEIGREKAASLRAAYGEGEGSLRICYADGDHRSQDRQIGEGRFDVAILVNEKLKLFQQNPRFFAEVGEVVCDELDMIGDGERGVFLEMALTGALHAHDRMTALGLLCPCADAVRALAPARALGRETFCLETTRRPVAIDAGIWTPQTQQAVYRNGNTGAERVETLELGPHGDLKRTLKALLVRFLKQTPLERRRGLRNNLVLAVPMKRNNVEYAGLLADLYEEDAEVRAILDANKVTDLLEDRLRCLEPSARKATLQRILPLGIGLHDADLSLEERRLVGEAFRDGEIPVLLCTSTMAQGVNLPCQSIVFLNWGQRPYAPPDMPEREPFYKTLEADFINWLGRVGRFGKKGHRPPTALYVASHATDSEEARTIRALLTEEKGRFTTALADIPSFSGPLLSTLLSLQHAGRTPTFRQIEQFLQSTPTATDPAGRKILSERALAGLMEMGRYTVTPEFQALRDCLEDVFRTNLDPGSVLLDTAQAEALIRLAGHLLKSIPRPEGLARTTLNALTKRIAREVGIDRPCGHSLQEARMPLEGLCACQVSRAPLEALQDLLTQPGFAALFLADPADAGSDLRAIRRVECEGRLAFELTGLGRIAYAHGIAIETCRELYRWVREQAGSEQGWDALDLLALVLQTPDGVAIPRLRVKSGFMDRVRAAFARHIDACTARLGEEWQERSPLAGIQDIATQATLLAMRDWRQGAPTYVDGGGSEGDREAGIEAAYGLNLYGTTLPRKAREIGRLLHVLAAVAAMLPSETFPPSRPEKLSPPSEGVLAVPSELAALAEEVIQGLPGEVAALARLGVDGLGRSWALQLFSTLEAKRIGPDLLVLERLQTLAENEEIFRAALPVHGLRERIKDQLCNAQHLPLAESLRQDPGLIDRYYGYPLVIEAQLAYGRDRCTAFRVTLKNHRTRLRRNRTRDKPIVLQEAGDLAFWLSRGAVEVLAETGRAFADGYRFDGFFVDLDPHAGYPLESLKSLALEILRRLEAHDWVESGALRIHWTGGKGFHLIAPFRQGIFRPVEPVKRALEGLLARLCN